MIDLKANKFWLIDWELARFDTKHRDVEHICLGLYLFNESRSVFDSRLVDYFLRRVQFEFLGNETADWRSRCEGENVRLIFAIWMFIYLHFFSQDAAMGFDMEKSIRVARRALKELA